MTDDTTYSLRGSDRREADPTALTTAALAREVEALKDLLTLRFEELERVCQGGDASINSEISLRQKAVDAKFDAVAREMQLVEHQRVEQKQDAMDSLAAALAAAKEAVKEQTTASALSINKSENATNEQLKQLTVTFATAIEGVNRTIMDLKERVGKNESVQAASGGVGQGKQQSWNVLIAAVIGAGSLFGIIMLIIELAVPR